MTSNESLNELAGKVVTATNALKTTTKECVATVDDEELQALRGVFQATKESYLTKDEASNTTISPTLADLKATPRSDNVGNLRSMGYCRLLVIIAPFSFQFRRRSRLKIIQ